MHAHPGRAERVLHQELDHVVLGVELRGRDDVGAGDLGPLDRADLLEHPLLLLGVPILVGPAQGIGRGEGFGSSAPASGRFVFLEADAVLAQRVGIEAQEAETILERGGEGRSAMPGAWGSNSIGSRSACSRKTLSSTAKRPSSSPAHSSGCR